MNSGEPAGPGPLRIRGDAAELETKRARLIARSEARGAGAMVVRRADTLAWLLGGADVLVSRQAGPVVEAVVHATGVEIVTNRIESERLRKEELPDGCNLHAVPWEEPGALRIRSHAIARAASPSGDIVDDGEVDVTDARWPLLDVEVERLRAAGRVTATTLTDVIAGLEPDLSEHAAAGRAIGALRSRGLHVPVVLVAGASRFGSVRHPVPTHAPLGAAALVVVCSEARGLVNSTSRIVQFGVQPGPIAERLAQVLQVESAMLTATRPDARLEDVLGAARTAYTAVGHPEAWRDHHQGGPIGYRPREWLVTPGDQRPLLRGAAYAWNPSLPWAKAEDTFFLSESGLENVTWDDRWPSLMIDGRARADVLRL